MLFLCHHVCRINLAFFIISRTIIIYYYHYLNTQTLLVPGCDFSTYLIQIWYKEDCICKTSVPSPHGNHDNTRLGGPKQAICKIFSWTKQHLFRLYRFSIITLQMILSPTIGSSIVFCVPQIRGHKYSLGKVVISCTVKELSKLI